jgi:hypothetical protein
MEETRLQYLNRLVAWRVAFGSDNDFAHATQEEKEYIKREAERRARAMRDWPESVVIEAFKTKTPLSHLTEYFKFLGDDDTQTCRKAFVMACFSELTYLCLTKREVQCVHRCRDRYKIFPSHILRELSRRGPLFNASNVIKSVADIGGDSPGSINPDFERAKAESW